MGLSPGGKANRKTFLDDEVKYYTDIQLFYIRGLYLIAILIWVLIVIFFRLFDGDIISCIIILLPIVIFALNYCFVGGVDTTLEEQLFQINYLSLGVLLVLPMLSWINGGKGQRKDKFIRILVLSIILSMLSMIDIWVSREWLSFVVHLKSIFETVALILMIYALYTYYVHDGDEILIKH